MREEGRWKEGHQVKWNTVHEGGSSGGSMQIWHMEAVFSSSYLSPCRSLCPSSSLSPSPLPSPLLGSPSSLFLLTEWKEKLCARRRKQLKINGSWVIEKPARACRPPHTHTHLKQSFPLLFMSSHLSLLRSLFTSFCFGLSLLEGQPGRADTETLNTAGDINYYKIYVTPTHKAKFYHLITTFFYTIAFHYAGLSGHHILILEKSELLHEIYECT